MERARWWGVSAEDLRQLAASADKLTVTKVQRIVTGLIARTPKRVVIHSRSRSQCCRALQQLVRSRSGNYVTQDCVACGKKATTLSLSEIPNIKCPKCSNPLSASYIGRNYGFTCGCGCTLELGDIVPNWEEEGFAYCGVGVSSTC
jgi:hypothetical protein